MNLPPKVLVLGSNSFAGSVFTKTLLEKGVEVLGMNRSPELPRVYQAYFGSNLKDRFVFMQGGSNFNVDYVVEVCEAQDIKTVVNFSAQSMVAESWDEPWDWYQTNCVWLSQLVGAFVNWGKLKKFIHFTTPEVYGSTDSWIKENQIFMPSTPYAISRAAGDLHLLAEFKRSGFPVVFTRASNIFGPHQRRNRIIPKALISAAMEYRIELHGGGRSERSFIYMEDVARALLLLLVNSENGRTYHISSGVTHTVREVVERCYQVMDKSPDKYLLNTFERPGKDHSYKLDSTRIKEEIGWGEEVGFEDGLLRTKIWVVENLKLLLAENAEYKHAQ